MEPTVTNSVSDAEVLAAIDETVHVTVLPLFLRGNVQAHPAGTLALWKPAPAGSVSVSTTFVASLGPALVTVTA